MGLVIGSSSLFRVDKLLQVLYYLGEAPDAPGVAFRSVNHQLVVDSHPREGVRRLRLQPRALASRPPGRRPGTSSKRFLL